jgi:hypothetical protein
MSAEEKISLQDAIDTVTLATCEGDWHSLGNTFWICDKKHSAKGMWIALPGDCERAEAIASLPKVCSDLINEVRRLQTYLGQGHPL